MGMFKRFLALLLVAAMLVSELPVAALAEMMEETAQTQSLREILESSVESTEAPVVAQTTEETQSAVETESAVTETTAATEPEETSAPETAATEATEETPVEMESMEATAAAAEGVYDNLTWDYDEENCILTISGDGRMEDASGWLDYGWQVETLLIEEGVTTIQDGAFWGFPNLTLVLLPNSLESIGNQAFAECTGLNHIVIPEGVTYIGQGAFQDCENLYFVQIFGYDVTIDDNAFGGVSAEVAYPYDSAWSDKGNYGGSLSWMPYARTVGTGLYGASRWTVQESGYMQISGLGQLEAQNSPEDYPWYPYADSVGMVNVSGVENLPKKAFAGFENLSNVVINWLDSIGAGAFSGCENLQSISFYGCPEIADDAFSGVTASVDFDVYDGWTEENMLDYGGSLSWLPSYNGEYGDGIGWELVGNELEIYSYGTHAEMANQTSAGGYPWYEHRDRILSVYVSDVSVGDYAFDGFSGLEDVSMYSPGSVGTFAFRNCENLTNIDFQGEPPAIAANAFTGVTAQVIYESGNGWTEEHFQNYGGSLTWNEISYGPSDIASGTHGENVSWRLDADGHLDISGGGEMASMTSAEGYPWYEYRDQIQRIAVTGVSSVGDYAFAGYPVLTDLDLTESVTKVGSRILDGSTAVEFVTFNCAPPTTIAEDALAGLSGAWLLYPYRYSEQWQSAITSTYGGTDLEWSEYTVSIANGEIGNGIFWNIQEGGNLSIHGENSDQPIVIPDMEEGKAPWSGYANMISGVYLDNVVSIGRNAFRDCTALTSAYIIGTDMVIGEMAFADCTALKDIHLRGTVSSIGENAFRNVTATVYYDTEPDSALLQNYGGSLTWRKTAYGDQDLASGTHGENVSWNLNSYGFLRISGDGEMLSMTSAEDYPWYAYRDQIQWVVVNGVSSVGDYAFAGYPELIDLELEESVTKVGSRILDGSTAVRNVTFDCAPPHFAEDALAGLSGASLMYPYRHSELWKTVITGTYGGTDLEWSEYTVSIADGSVGDGLYWSLQESGHLFIGSEEIGKPIVIPDMEAGNAPWRDYADMIRSVYLENVVSIGRNAFYGCTALTNVSLSGTDMVIREMAFADCTALTQVSLRGAVSSIGENAFRNVTATIHYNKELGSAMLQNYGGALNWNRIYTTVDSGSLGDLYWDLLDNGELALYAMGETSMPSLASPEAYPWHNYADQITSISVSNVTNIGDYAFADCIGVTRFVFDYCISKLGNYIFTGCVNLMELVFQGDAPEFSDNTFYGVNAFVVLPFGNPTWTLDIQKDYGGMLAWPIVEEEEPAIGGACGENLTWTLGSDDKLIISGTGAMADYDPYEVPTPWADYADEIQSLEIRDGVTAVSSSAFYGLGNLTEVTIADSVTALGEAAFEECTNLTAVTLPAGLTAVSDYLFLRCGALTNIVLPDSVERIGVCAFMGCKGLTEITIPSGVTAIGDNAFSQCSNLKTVTMLGDAPSMFEEVFYRVTANIYYPAGNDTWTENVMRHYGGTLTWLCAGEIGGSFGEKSTWVLKQDGTLVISGYDMPAAEDAPWQEYKDQVRAIEFCGNITILNGNQFRDYTALTRVALPEFLETVGYSAFENCENLTEVTFGSEIIQLGNNAFRGCTALTGIALPDSVTTLAYGVFDGCENLETVTFGSDIQTIGSAAFRNCTSLTGIVIPDTVTALGNFAFENCTSLTEIALPGSLVRVSAELFKGCSGLMTVELSKGISEIGANAFRSCVNLTEITIPESVNTIGNEVFFDCGSLTDITMTGDMPAMGENAFAGITATIHYPMHNATWSGAVLPDYDGRILWLPYEKVIAEGSCGTNLRWELTESGKLTVSGTGAMENYTQGTAPWSAYAESISRVVVEEGITAIGEFSFSGCRYLISAELPEGLLTIEQGAFRECWSLSEIRFPDGLEKIRGYSFYDCSTLETVEFPDSLIYIGGSAFMQSGLAGDLVIPGGATVSTRAFAHCFELNGTLTIESGAEKTVGQDAFTNCAITGLVLGEGITQIGEYAFAYCNDLTGEVTIPESVTTIGKKSFNGSTLEHIRFEAVNCPAITDNTLGDLPGLKSIYVPGENYASYQSLLVQLPETVEIQTDWEYFPVEELWTDGTYSRTVVLNWMPHRSSLAESYIILRDGVQVGTATECTYTDRTLEPEHTYQYAVQAVFADGKTSALSEETTAKTVTPEIDGLYGYQEYANRKIFANTCNRICMTVVNKDNLLPLGYQKTTMALYYTENGEETLIGYAEPDMETFGSLVSYFLDWNLSVLSDGEYTLRAVLTDVDGATDEWTETVFVDNTPPEKLMQLTVTGSEQDIALSWTEAKEYDTVGYRIYRSVGNKDNFEALTAIPGRNVLSYTDTTAPETETCYYYVVGLDIFGREALEYDIVGGTRITDTVKPRVVQLLPVSGSTLTGTAAFTLKAEDNVAVTKRNLQYSADEGMTWTEIPQVEGRYTLDTAAWSQKQIRVRAYAHDAAGNVSDALEQVYAIDNVGPAQVTGLSHVSTGVTLTLRWQDVEDADIGSFLVEQLQSDGTYRVIAQNVTALGYNLQGLTPGTEYTFRVTGRDIYGNLGTPSEAYTASTEADTTAPVTVQLLPAPGAFADKISLSATVQDDYCVTSAVLEYSLDRVSWTELCSKHYSDVAAVRKISGELDLTDIPEGMLYVRARAVDLAGNASSESTFAQHMVDKTAPAVPDMVTAIGGNGYVELRWASSVDAAAYRIERSLSEDGIFVQLAGNHAYLNYVDRTAENDVTYYYRVAAIDAAGNVGEYCDAVSAKTTADTQAPEILSIAPAKGSILSPALNQVSVLAKDNSALESLRMEYSHDGESYFVLVEQNRIQAYGTTLAAAVPVAEFDHGDTVFLRITAVDTSDNVSVTDDIRYTVDTQAPEVRDVSALYTDAAVQVSWTGGAEDDLAGYRIYRRNSAGVNTLLVQLAAEAGRTAYSWADSSLPLTGGTFTYLVEAVDEAGNTATGSSGESGTTVVEVPARTGPTALLSCDSVMTKDVAYIIDGSGSTDDGYIISYEYDFGDGTTGTGKSPIHTYTQEGTYRITLTVTDNDGQSHVFSKKVTVKAPELVGNVTVRILDEKGAPVPNAPVYFDLGEENQVIRGTNPSGYVTFTADVGRHTVGCVILDNQWLPVKRDVIVRAGEETSVSMTLINKPIVEGRFEIKRMTLEEIEAAGIDLTDPANQYYVELELHLVYKNTEMTQTIPGDALTGGRKIIFDPSGKYKPDKEDDEEEDDPIIIKGNDDDDDDDDDDIRSWSVELIDKSKDPKVMILDIPIGVRSLKEMFDVRLHILNNSSSEFSMKNNVITLNTPSGLSVVTDAYKANQQTVNVAEIPGQTQKTVEWIVRGDQAGEYTLSADYSGILSQFNEPLTARFVAQDPIQVYAMSGLKLEVIYADQLDKGTLYYNVMMTNDGEVDVYKPGISTEDILIEMELFDQAGLSKAEMVDFSAESIAKVKAATSLSALPDVLKVGDSLLMHYMCIDQTDYTHCKMKLQKATLDIQNTYGLTDDNVKYYSKPLSYFKGSFSASINPVEKAEQTLHANAGAYQQLMDNYRYICWCLVNNKVPDNYLPTDEDEKAWEIAQGEFLTAHKTDIQQAKALILELLALTADATEEAQYSVFFKWIGEFAKVVRALKMETSFGITVKQRTALQESLDILTYTTQTLYEYMAERNYTFDQLFVELWETKCEELGAEPLADHAAQNVLHRIYAEEEMVQAWKNIGLEAEVAERVVKSLEETAVDVSLYLRAQANVETYLFLLDTLILNADTATMEGRYGKNDTWIVVDALKEIRKAIAEEDFVGKLANHVLEQIEEMIAGKAVDWATDKLLEVAGASAGGIFKFAQVVVKVGAMGLDALMNISEQYKMADNLRFVAILSDAAKGGVSDARNRFRSDGGAKSAEEYMELLTLMLDLRALGESQAALYGKSFETDFTIGNLPLLKAVRKMTDANESTSWYQWRNIVEDRISRLRVQLLKNPLNTEVTGRERPTVSFNYESSQTVQSFDSSYEYSLDQGVTWIPCNGGPIWVQRPETSLDLWVRRVNREQTDMVGTGSVTVYAPQRLYDSGLEVLKTDKGYRIENLDGDKRYQLTFSEDALSVSYDMNLNVTVPEGSTSYTLDTNAAYRYVYIRTLAGKTSYASHISRLDVANTVTLKTFVTGAGLIMDHGTNFEYGSEVSVTAVPAENRVFDGWYRDGVKVSGSQTYTFRIYASQYLEARFRELEPLSGSSAPINGEDGSAAVTMADGTVIAIIGAPEEAQNLVVETPDDAQIQNWIAECMADIGQPAQILKIYTVDSYREPMVLQGETVTVQQAGIPAGMLLCGITEEGTVTILDNSFQDGEITFTANGSACYVLAHLPEDRQIDVEFSEQPLLPGQKVTLSARFLPGNPTGAKLQWALAEGDDAYATLKVTGNTATLTALSATGSRDVTVTVSASDGSFPDTAVQIRVLPYVHQLTLLDGESDVTGSKIKFDINGERKMLELTAVAAPTDAIQDVNWTISGQAGVAEVTNGLVSFGDKTGTVKITATANDGSKKSASVTVEVVALVQKVEMAPDSVSELVGGKSFTFQAINSEDGEELSKRQITWSLDPEYAPYASITEAGKLTARKVAEATEIVITGRVVDNEKIGVVHHTVTLRPAVSLVELYYKGQAVGGETILVDVADAKETALPSAQLEAVLYPDGTMEGVTWKSKTPSIADVDPESGLVTVKWNPKTGTCKTGTVVITATAKDGSKAAGSVKVNFGAFVQQIDIEAPKTTLRSGDKMTLTALLTPSAPTKGGVTWSLAGEDDGNYASISASGTLTAKTVYDTHEITVLATAKDGSGISDDMTVTIRPRDEDILTIEKDGKNVTKSTVIVDMEKSPNVTLKAVTLGADVPENVTWKVSSRTVPLTDHKDGSATVTMQKVNSAVTVTATADGKTATVTLKAVRMTTGMEVGVKSGDMAVASGKSLSLVATVEPANATDRRVLWSVAEKDSTYATITSSGKLTAAKNLTEERTITVVAETNDGGCRIEVPVKLTPVALGVGIYLDNQAVENTTLVHNMVEKAELKLEAKVYPLNEANASVTWSSSNKKIATVEPDGTVTCLNAGTVTITAAADDDSKQKATFKLKVEKWMTQLTLPKTAVVAGGKTLTITKHPDFVLDSQATNKNLVWSMSGEGAAFATLSKGVLKTKKVTEPKTLTVTAAAVDGSKITRSCDVTIYPITTKVMILQNGEAVPKTLTLSVGAEIDLDGSTLPVNAAQDYTWKSSSADYASVDQQTGVVTAHKPGKTVTITCTAADGSGKNATVRIQVVEAT